MTEKLSHSSDHYIPVGRSNPVD